jgi:alanine-glyoxylate transaminase/serine-glyoxylate transaminase/serine-pyruvate transaminase
MIFDSDDDKLLLIPGPTPVRRDILDALAIPTIAHTSMRLADIMSTALKHLKTVAGTKDGRAFVIAGSGTLAQEASLLNFVAPEDTLLVASNGFFASRLAEIASQHGMKVVVRTAEPGTSITPDGLDQALHESGATVVTFTHVETATGVMAPLAEFMRVIRRNGALSIVDGVAGFGGTPEPMDELGIDVLLTGAQKALGVPPGLAIIIAGHAAWERRLARTDALPTYYADLARWAPIMERPEKYFSTHPVNMIRALGRALEIIMTEGLDARYRRHRRLAENFRGGLTEMGFEPFTDSDHLAPTLSAVRTPRGVTSSRFRERLASNGVVSAGGLGDPDDRVVRFGHMGNIADGDIATALEAISRSLN